MSLHKSKGLSADLVVVVGCIEGLIPSLPEKATAGEREKAFREQRRPFYVAVTRARRELVLSSVVQMPRDLAYKMRVSTANAEWYNVSTITSRFVGELGPECPAAILGTDL